MQSKIIVGAILSVYALAAQTPSFDLTTVPTTIVPQSLVVGDFNGDGKPDLAVSGITSGSGAVEILLGNGDGAFRSAAVIPLNDEATRIVKADFNNDGKADLAVLVGGNGQVAILLGKGDGTFQSPVDSGAKTPAGQLSAAVPGLAVGDVNGDGKIDLVLGPYTFTANCSVAVMMGNGDGTFKAPVNSSLDRMDAPQLMVGDLNGDGRTDAFVTGTWSTFGRKFEQLLGNADGSMTLNPSSQTSELVLSAVATLHDVNGNGRPDAIVLTYLDYPDDGRLNPWVFLDGSLQTDNQCCGQNIPIDSHAGLDAVSLAAGDVNGDGNPDLLLSDSVGNLLVMLGNGSGGFQGPFGEYPPASPSPTIYTGANATFSDSYSSLTTADFRGTGKQDVVMALSGGSVKLLKNSAGAAPAVAVSDLMNAASLTATPAVPGSLMAIFGSGLAYSTGTVQFPQALIPDLPDTLFGLTIQANTEDVPLLYVSPQQANFQVPWDLTPQTQATILVTRNGMTQTITVPVAAYAPGLFAMNGQGTGQAAALVVVTPPAIAAPTGAFPGSRPIHRGEYLSLYGTGLGAILHNQNPITGTSAPIGILDPTAATPLVRVGGVAATVQFSGLAPGMVGVYQVNILIPDGAPTGSAVPVALSIGGAAANIVTVAIQ